jgi:two-component system response regulator FlrC
MSKDDDVSYDMKTLEKNHIMKTLAAVNGSRKLAVKRLGISERTLRNKLQQYRLAEC